jgi:BirA family transcriptional regulator, biotin operon repressor / biotin---[acetyl-CoA-carboxylase] ligase
MNLPQITDRLRGLPVPAVRYFDSIASTNTEALQWAAAGAENGSLVIADQQTRGRGRFDRKWITMPGSALAFSLILRPTAIETPYVGLFSALGALGVSTSLETLGCSHAEIKWPNDVLLDGMKVCGILCESSWMGDRLDALVLGIGINVAPSSVPPANDLLFPATCVQQSLGRFPERLELLQRVLMACFAWRPALPTGTFLKGWEQRLAYRGQVVRIEQAEQSPIEGTLQGVNPDGTLRLQKADGEQIIIMAGDVRLRPV